MATTVSLYQFRRALGASSEVSTISMGMTADLSDPVKIQWEGLTTTTQGDALSNYVKTALGFSDAQMTALYAAAALVE